MCVCVSDERVLTLFPNSPVSVQHLDPPGQLCVACNHSLPGETHGVAADF